MKSATKKPARRKRLLRRKRSSPGCALSKGAQNEFHSKAPVFGAFFIVSGFFLRFARSLFALHQHPERLAHSHQQRLQLHAAAHRLGRAVYLEHGLEPIFFTRVQQRLRQGSEADAPQPQLRSALLDAVKLTCAVMSRSPGSVSTSCRATCARYPISVPMGNRAASARVYP